MFSDLFWDLGAPFGLTSLKLIVTLAGLGIAAVLILLWRIQRRASMGGASIGGTGNGQARSKRPRSADADSSSRPRRGGFGALLLDVGLYTVGVVFPVLSFLFLFNRSATFYASFAELAQQFSALAQ